MPSLNLSPDQIPHVICLPGTALIRCLKPKPETESGLAIPEAAASWAQENQAIREGIVESINCGGKGRMIRFHRKKNGYLSCTHRTPSRNYKFGSDYDDEDSQSINCGSHVYYLGRQDERHDDYVIVKIGQIVAIREPFEI
jgi:hypothetical protein